MLGAPRWASVSPTRGLAPDVTIDGSDRIVLVYRRRWGPWCSRCIAPIYASVTGRAGGTTSKRPDEPTVRPARLGAIAVWQEPGANQGVALDAAGFTLVRAEPARDQTGLGEDFDQAYDLAAQRLLRGAHLDLGRRVVRVDQFSWSRPAATIGVSMKD